MFVDSAISGRMIAESNVKACSSLWVQARGYATMILAFVVGYVAGVDVACACAFIMIGGL